LQQNYTTIWLFSKEDSHLFFEFFEKIFQAFFVKNNTRFSSSVALFFMGLF